jgi:hypothetical protein
MIKLFKDTDYKKAKEQDLLALKCENCGDVFYAKKVTIRNAMNPKRGESCKHCSQKCTNAKKIKKIKVNCNFCGNITEKHPSQLKLHPISYCNKSCASKYSNSHKTKGTNRSKLELWLEEKLTLIYPNIQIDYNKTNAINAELDIYIPSLSIAFELNGIFHYEPIFGIEKLNKTQKNDKRKIQACIDAGINFCIINTTELKYFKEDRAKKFLDIITDIINENIKYS